MNRHCVVHRRVTIYRIHYAGSAWKPSERPLSNSTGSHYRAGMGFRGVLMSDPQRHTPQSRHENTKIGSMGPLLHKSCPRRGRDGDWVIISRPCLLSSYAIRGVASWSAGECVGALGVDQIETQARYGLRNGNGTLCLDNCFAAQQYMRRLFPGQLN